MLSALLNVNEDGSDVCEAKAITREVATVSPALTILVSLLELNRYMVGIVAALLPFPRTAAYR